MTVAKTRNMNYLKFSGRAFESCLSALGGRIICRRSSLAVTFAYTAIIVKILK